MIAKNVYKLRRYVSQVLLAFLLSVFFMGTVQAAPPAQDPRPPTNPGTSPEPSSDTSGDSGDDSPAAIICASVEGEIMNWGYRLEPGINTSLKTGSWEVSDVSGDDGSYGFSGLGVGLAMLNVSLAPGEQLQPLIQDAAVYLTCDYPTFANIALFSGTDIELPVSIQMLASSAAVNSSERTEITITIENTLPTEITNVVVTDLIPAGLVALEASVVAKSEEATAQIFDGGDDGQLVVAYLDKIGSGERANVLVQVSAIEDTPHANATNTATLFYRESAAVQTSLDLAIGQNNVTIPAAVTGQTAALQPLPKAEGETAEQTEASAETQADVEPVALAHDDEMTDMAADTQPSTDVSAVEPSSTSSDEATKAEAQAEDETSTDFEPPTTKPLLPQTGEEIEAPEIITENPVIPTLASDGATASPTLIIGLSILILGFIGYGLKSVYWPKT